jgi:hypothetical protein
LGLVVVVELVVVAWVHRVVPWGHLVVVAWVLLVHLVDKVLLGHRVVVTTLALAVVLSGWVVARSVSSGTSAASSASKETTSLRF